MPSRNIDRLSDTEWAQILDWVYEAALRPEIWGDVLLKIGQPINAHGGQLVVMAKDASHFAENLLAGVDTERGRREFAELVEVGQHVRANAVMALEELATISDYSHTTEAQMRYSAFYQDHAIPLGVSYYGASILKKTGETFIASAVFRSKRFGNLNAREIAYLRRLAPHLRRSIEISLRLPDEGVVDGVMSGLERMSCGAIVVDKRASIVAMNSRAQQMVLEADGIADSAGLVSVWDKKADHDIRREIMLSIGFLPSKKAAGTGCVVARRPSGKESYTLFVTPIRHRQGPIFGTRHAIVLIIDPESSVNLSPNVLSSAFDLTPAESRVAVLLTSGLSLDQIAKERQTTVETIRSQLKRIFLKTGCRHQAELVGKLNSVQAVSVIAPE